MKKIGLGVLIVVTGFLIYVAMKPSEFYIARQMKIQASSDLIFPYVNDFQQFDIWNPWAKIDPKAKKEIHGPSGVGATSAWDGDANVGKGVMTIVESVPSLYLKMRLDFEKPFVSSAIVEFTFQQENGATQVSWGMKGKNNFFSRLMCTFMDMDKMIGGNFEKGLTDLKVLVESHPH